MIPAISDEEAVRRSPAHQGQVAGAEHQQDDVEERVGQVDRDHRGGRPRRLARDQGLPQQGDGDRAAVTAAMRASRTSSRLNRRAQGRISTTSAAISTTEPAIQPASASEGYGCGTRVRISAK